MLVLVLIQTRVLVLPITLVTIVNILFALVLPLTLVQLAQVMVPVFWQTLVTVATVGLDQTVSTINALATH